ncbi:hypothetical protein BDO18943_05388 [Burkholderia dolosa]|nr:hypothetical protein BDO18943_05388 [Burkholderia dolosa]
MCAADGRILHAAHVQIAADIRRNRATGYRRADHVRIATADERHAIRAHDVRIVLHRRVAVAITVRTRHRCRNADAVRADRHANAAARRRIRAARRIGVRRVLQVDLALGSEQHVFAGYVRASDRNVAATRRAVARRNQRSRTACAEARTALCRLVFRRVHPTMARSDAYLDADARRTAAGKCTTGQAGDAHRSIACCRDRVQRSRAAIPAAALGGLRLLVSTIDRIADAARQAERDAAAARLLAMRFVRGIRRRVDHDIRCRTGQVLPGDQIATSHVQRIAGRDIKVTVERSDRARVVRDGRRMIRFLPRLRADADSQSARSQTRMRLTVVAVLRDRILGRGDIDVVRRGEIHVVRADDRAALDGQVVPRLNVDGVARHSAADTDIGARICHPVGLRAADEAAALDLHRLVLVVFLACLVDRDIARRTDVCRAGTVLDAVRHTRRQSGAGQRHVALGLVGTHGRERRVSARCELRADHMLVVVVIRFLARLAVRRDVIELRRVCDGRRRQIAAREQRQILAGRNGGTLERRIVAALHG